MFKVGDKVRRFNRTVFDSPVFKEDKVWTVSRCSADPSGHVNIELQETSGRFDPANFRLCEPETTVTIPGIPDGYGAVRFGIAVKGDYYLGCAGMIEAGPSHLPHLIVEPIPMFVRLIEAGEGFRLIDPSVDKPQIGDEYWSLKHSEWIRRVCEVEPFHTGGTYRRRIQKTEKITFHEVVVNANTSGMRSLAWVEVVGSFFATGLTVQVEVPVKQ